MERSTFFVFALYFFVGESSIQQLLPIFFNYVPQWSCTNTSTANFTFEWAKNCTIFHECPKSNLHYKAPFHSVVQDFGLACLPYKAALVSTVQFVGVFCGTVGFGQVSDTFGRKKVSLLVLASCILFGTVSSLAPNWRVLAVIRFFVGLSVGGAINVVFAYAVELIQPEQRIMMRAFMTWGWGRLLTTAICYALPYWKHAFLAVSLVCLPELFIIIFILPESPKWLEGKRRYKEMAEAQAKLDWFNGKSSEQKQQNFEQKDTEQKKLYTYKDLFSSKSVLITTLTLMTMWFGVSLSSFANDLNSRNLGGSFWVNQFTLSAAIACSSPIIVVFDRYVKNFSRRHLHQIPQFLIVVNFVAIIVLLSLHLGGSTAILVLNLVGTICIEFTWHACYICAAECFPTVVRSIGIGCCNFLARIGGILAPQMTYLANLWLPAPFAAVAVVAFISLVVSWKFLPDTKNIELVTDLNQEKKEDPDKTELPHRTPVDNLAFNS